MGENRLQLWLGQHGKCDAGDDNGVRTPVNAVGRGLWSINTHGVQPCLPTADQKYRRGMSVGLAADAHEHPHQPCSADRDSHRTESDEKHPQLQSCSGLALRKTTQSRQAVGKHRTRMVPVMREVSEGKHRRRGPGHQNAPDRRHPGSHAQSPVYVNLRSTGGPTASTAMLNNSKQAATLTWRSAGFALRSFAMRRVADRIPPRRSARRSG